MNPKNKKIDGKAIASRILDKLEKKVSTLNSTPTLAIILVGSDPASKAYVHQKVLKAKSIGAKVMLYSLPANISSDNALKLLKKLNNDNNVHGIIVQRPLPKQISSDLINKAIAPEKDVDAFHPETKFNSPVGVTVLKILEEVFIARPLIARPRRSYARDLRGLFDQWLKNKTIVVIGKGEAGGKLIAQALRRIGAQPLIIDSKTKNPQNLTKKADIIICAVGKPNIIKPSMIKKGVILISVGLHKGSDGRLHGDYDEDDIKDIVSFYTPTPGGVGPVNVACLLENLIESI